MTQSRILYKETCTCKVTNENCNHMELIKDFPEYTGNIRTAPIIHLLGWSSQDNLMRVFKTATNRKFIVQRNQITIYLGRHIANRNYVGIATLTCPKRPFINLKYIRIENIGIFTYNFAMRE